MTEQEIWELTASLRMLGISSLFPFFVFLLSTEYWNDLFPVTYDFNLWMLIVFVGTVMISLFMLYNSSFNQIIPQEKNNLMYIVNTEIFGQVGSYGSIFLLHLLHFESELIVISKNVHFSLLLCVSVLMAGMTLASLNSIYFEYVGSTGNSNTIKKMLSGETYMSLFQSGMAVSPFIAIACKTVIMMLNVSITQAMFIYCILGITMSLLSRIAFETILSLPVSADNGSSRAEIKFVHDESRQHQCHAILFALFFASASSWFFGPSILAQVHNYDHVLSEQWVLLLVCIYSIGDACGCTLSKIWKPSVESRILQLPFVRCALVSFVYEYANECYKSQNVLIFPIIAGVGMTQGYITSSLIELLFTVSSQEDKSSFGRLIPCVMLFGCLMGWSIAWIVCMVTDPHQRYIFYGGIMFV